MAKKHDVTAKMGRLVEVMNQNAKWNECKDFYSMKVEFVDGNDEFYIILTKKEYESCSTFECKQITESMKLGRLYPVFIGKQSCYLVNVQYYGTNTKTWYNTCIRISSKKLSNAKRRAERNPEDIEKVNYFFDLLD